MREEIVIYIGQIIYTIASYVFLFIGTSPRIYENFGPEDVVLLVTFTLGACYGTLKILRTINLWISK